MVVPRGMHDINEANSALDETTGHETVSSEGRLHAIRTIQNDLFDLGADLATPGDDFTPSEMVLRIIPSQVRRLEDEIDAMNADMAALTSFILPGGSPLAATLHVARAGERRARGAVRCGQHFDGQ